MYLLYIVLQMYIIVYSAQDVHYCIVLKRYIIVYSAQMYIIVYSVMGKAVNCSICTNTG